jgi:DNA mismatch repair protein MutS
VERITARLALNQVRPRELVALRHALQKHELLTLIRQAPAAYLTQISADLEPPGGALDLLRAALLEEPAALIRDGGVIATGAGCRLDELRAIQTNCDAFLLDLETRERAHRHRQPARAVQQGARLLHRGHARPGVEQGAGRLPPPPDAEKRRALHHARAEEAFEDKALSAQERALAREKWLYEQLLDALQPHVPI